MTTETSTAARALRQLARAGARTQVLFALRDAAVIMVIGAVVFALLSKPAGIVISVMAIIMFALFALAVTTSGSRLQKAVDESERIRVVVFADTTKRPALSRAWVVGNDRRIVTVPFRAVDADVVAATFARATTAQTLVRVADEVAARSEVARASGS